MYLKNKINKILLFTESRLKHVFGKRVSESGRSRHRWNKRVFPRVENKESSQSMIRVTVCLGGKGSAFSPKVFEKGHWRPYTNDAGGAPLDSIQLLEQIRGHVAHSLEAIFKHGAYLGKVDQEELLAWQPRPLENSQQVQAS